ncbi:MAG: hypothetical protein M3513_00370 [Actinomycetota bacterium]|nr:hypothetical protein [Actinomycetota bacterium]
MPVLIAWIVALVVSGLVLGIVGFQVVGQLARTGRAVSAFRRDIEPRVPELLGQLQRDTSGGRHSAERQPDAERMHSRR